MSSTDRPARGKIWSAFVLLLACINIADYLYEPASSLHHLLQGVGFLFVVPMAYLYPIRFNVPLSEMARPVEIKPWLTACNVTGTALLLAGIVVMWV